MRRGISGIVAAGLMAAFAVAATNDPAPLAEPPIRWVPPPTFDPGISGCGLPMAPGVEHTVIYDPLPSRANVDEGGSGIYESVLHGVVNHHPNWIFVGDHVITRWTNHSYDENGPGQRVLGRIGRWVGDRNGPGARIEWGDPIATTVELAPPPVRVMRRTHTVHPDTIFPYVEGYFTGAGDDTVYVRIHLTCIGGYTTKEANRRPTGPLPAAEYSDSASRATGFRYDFWFNLGLEYVQRWRIVGDRLAPDGPMYRMTPLVSRVEVTPGRFKTVAPLLPPYDAMVPIEQAPEDIRRAFPPLPPQPAGWVMPQFKDGAHWLAADGKNGLSHFSEYRRGDGKWVSIRDNLLNPGHYYASIRESDGWYPPAMETNLYGYASPRVGALADGRVWIVCNSQRRHDMFITLSRDGIVFDRTWNILHAERQASGIYTGGGPQYFHAQVVGSNMWIFYSIGKVQMGVTKLPLADL